MEEGPRDRQLPEVILLGPPMIFKPYSQQFSAKFQILKPWESKLPLPHFLEAHAQNSRAAVCAGWFPLSASVLSHLPSLRLVVTTSAGVDQVDLIECRRRDIAVANVGTIFSADVADLAVGLLIDVLRKVSSANGFVKSGIWCKQGDYPLAFKRTVRESGIENGARLRGFRAIRDKAHLSLREKSRSDHSRAPVSCVYRPDSKTQHI